MLLLLKIDCHLWKFKIEKDFIRHDCHANVSKKIIKLGLLFQNMLQLCIEKVYNEKVHNGIQLFYKLMHQLYVTTASQSRVGQNSAAIYFSKP